MSDPSNTEYITIHRNIAKLRDIELFYLDTRTEGPVILCLHGRWGRAETWADFMQHYGDRYRIIAPDQRGHGLSGKPVSYYTGEEMAADMKELLDYLQLDSVIVVGHSMGGQVAGYFTALYPEYVQKAAFLDKSAAGPAQRSELPLHQLPAVDPTTGEWPLPFATLAEARKFIKQATGTELGYRHFMSSLTETATGYELMFSQQAMAANVAYYAEWYHLLPDIHCPVLLIRAKNSPAVPDDALHTMQSLLTNCLSFEMSHPDHNVHLSDQEQFYRYFDVFLNTSVSCPV